MRFYTDIYLQGTASILNSSGTNILEAKQDTLVSGTNIKTINNNSILGNGNIDIAGGSGLTNFSESVVLPAFESRPQIILSVNTTCDSADLILCAKGSGSLSNYSVPSLLSTDGRGASSVDIGFCRTYAGNDLYSESSVYISGFTCGGNLCSACSVIIGGDGNFNRCNLFGSGILASNFSTISYSPYSTIVGGINSLIYNSCCYSIILSGRSNCIVSTSYNNSILASICSCISGFYSKVSTIISSDFSTICDSGYAAVIASKCSRIISNCILNNTERYAVLIGKNSQIGSNDTTTMFAIGCGTSVPSLTTDNCNLLFCIDNTGKTTTNYLQVLGGTIGTGKVLTSDASGNASWQTASGLNYLCECFINCYSNCPGQVMLSPKSTCLNVDLVLSTKGTGSISSYKATYADALNSRSNYSIDLTWGRTTPATPNYSCYATVIGGYCLMANCSRYGSAIGGVCNSLVVTCYSNVVGGGSNSVCCAEGSSILGGTFNNIYNSRHTSIIGGCTNCIKSASNAIVGGCMNTVYGPIVGVRCVPAVLFGYCGQIGSSDCCTVFAIGSGGVVKASTSENYNLVFCVNCLGVASMNGICAPSTGLKITGLPTTNPGVGTGLLWNNAGVLTIA